MCYLELLNTIIVAHIFPSQQSSGIASLGTIIELKMVDQKLREKNPEHYLGGLKENIIT